MNIKNKTYLEGKNSHLSRNRYFGGYGYGDGKASTDGEGRGWGEGDGITFFTFSGIVIGYSDCSGDGENAYDALPL